MPIDLRKLRIASPCTESWASMSGDERLRHCAKCRLKVFNFEGMSAAEIEALLADRDGRVCVRLYRRRDGTVLTRDCPVGLRKARMKLAAAIALTAGVVLAVFGTTRRSLASRVETPASASSPMWVKAKYRALEMEDRARSVPVVGAVIEWIDPAPIYEMGDIAP